MAGEGDKRKRWMMVLCAFIVCLQICVKNNPSYAYILKKKRRSISNVL